MALVVVAESFETLTASEFEMCQFGSKQFVEAMINGSQGYLKSVHRCTAMTDRWYKLAAKSSIIESDFDELKEDFTGVGMYRLTGVWTVDDK